ncbi:hypothetical protein DFH06DRAFT_1231500 [Mycena polygramma]|nr:hypothetical protein DFH06DRAFT_1231500 [Mycena polygramma]
MANYSSFEAQPTEILDQIFDHIPDQSDLLALCFASPNLAEVLIPRYLPICCIDVQNTPLLQKLLLSPLRHQIPSLELVSKADTVGIILCGEERVLSLPNTHVMENADVDGTLPALLREMNGLRAFHWIVTGIPPSTNILAALHSRALPLESVKIHSLRPKGHNDVPDRWFLRDSPLWMLSNLTSFSFAVSSLTNYYNTGLYVQELLQMLSRCPMLEDLELLLAHDRSSDLSALFQQRWPQLKRLVIGGPETSYSATVPHRSKNDVRAFFTAHPKLERLYLSINLESGVRPLSYPWNDTNSPNESFGITSLSSLKLLHIPQNIFAVITSAAHTPHLEHLRCFEAEMSYLPRFQELTQNAPNITSIWLRLHRKLTLPAFKAFLACLPRLEKLYLTNGPPGSWVPIVPMPHAYYQLGRQHLATGTLVAFDPTDDPLTEACDALSVVPHLTHLPHFLMFHAHEAVDALVDPVVRRLAEVLPRLACLEVIVTGVRAPPTDTHDVLQQGINWLAIRRDAAGVCTGWTVIVDLEEEAGRLELDHLSWGSLNWPFDECPYDDPRDTLMLSL